MRFLPGLCILLWLLMSPTLSLAADNNSAGGNNEATTEPSDADGKANTNQAEQGDEEEDPDCE